MAPLVAALIKGGLPILAKALVTHGKDWVEEKTGIDLPSMEEPELTAEQLGQLRVAELKHKDTLAQAITAITGAEIADVDSARKLQMAAMTGKESWLSAHFIYLLTVFWSLASVAYLGCVTFMDVPANNQRIVDTILGFLLGTAISSIFGYFYGTSRSSSAKDGVVSRLLDRLSTKG